MSIDISKIPREILGTEILYSLDGKSLLSYCEVSKTIRDYCKNEPAIKLFIWFYTNSPDQFSTVRDMLKSENFTFKKSNFPIPDFSFLHGAKIIKIFSKVDKIPSSVFYLKKLEQFFSINNNISDIPTEIRKLKNLKRLYLNSNKISTIPKELGELKNLEILDLGNNKISKIPKEIGKLENLKTLILYGNEISKIPKEMENLEKLEKLILTGNNVSKKDVPAKLFENENLEIKI